MLKNRTYFLSALLMLWISLSVFPLIDGLSAAECQLIRIFGEKGAAGNQIQTEPVEATIPRDTCVVWINWVQWSNARIIFKRTPAPAAWRPNHPRASPKKKPSIQPVSCHAVEPPA